MPEVSRIERVINTRTLIRNTDARSFLACSSLARINRCRSSWITIPGGAACSSKRLTARAAPGRFWRKARYLAGSFAPARAREQ